MSDKGDRAVELSASYAHRVGEDIRVVLQLADEMSFESPPDLRLEAGRRRVHAATTPLSMATALEARVPAARLRPGVWQLALVGPEGVVTGLEARLLHSRRQPVALLPGPTPRTELPAPRPARVPVPDPTRRARVYHAAARVADKGLSVLPQERAARYRSVLSRVARRLL